MNRDGPVYFGFGIGTTVPFFIAVLRFEQSKLLMRCNIVIYFYVTG